MNCQLWNLKIAAKQLGNALTGDAEFMVSATSDFLGVGQLNLPMAHRLQCAAEAFADERKGHDDGLRTSGRRRVQELDMRIRMTQSALALGLSGMVLAACEATQTEETCGADDYRGLVGRPLAAVTLPADLDARIIGPDTAVTMDHRPERLNIAVAGSGIIERVYCG